jgi:hypothetical protein
LLSSHICSIKKDDYRDQGENKKPKEKKMNTEDGRIIILIITNLHVLKADRKNAQIKN